MKIEQRTQHNPSHGEKWIVEEQERSQQLQDALAKVECQKAELAKVATQEKILTQIIDRMCQTLDMQQIFATSTADVRQLLHADRVAIFRFHLYTNHTEGEFVAEDVAPGFKSALTTKVQDRCFGEDYATRYQDGKVLTISDTLAAGLSDCHLEILSYFEVRANLVIPLLQGELLWGLLCIHQCSGPREWQPEEVEFVSRIAEKLSVALQHSELLEQTQLRSLELQEALADVQSQKERIAHVAQQERALSQIIKKIRQSLEDSQIFQATTQEVLHLLNCDRVVLYRFFPDWSGEFVYESVTPGWHPLNNANHHTVWRDTYLQEHQGGRYRHHKTTVISDIYQANYSPCHLELLEEFQIRAFIVVPIFIGYRLWGLLGAYQNAGPRQWQATELWLLEKVGDQLGVALQQSELLQQLQQAKDNADAASQAKSAFLAHMSHELRTPLNAILGFSQLMRRDHTLTPKQQETLDTINRSGSHLLNLINDVLEMSKIEAGQITLHVSDFDLKRLLASLHEMFYLKAQSKGIELLYEYDPHLPRYISTDEGKLRQVLINLLSNAVKFTQQGQISLTVKQRVSSDFAVHTLEKSLPHTYYFDFAVADTGSGIASPELDSIFDIFTQTATGRQSLEGTGLGLAISRQFVQLMGGNISIQSQLGQGTEVAFSIQANLATMTEPSTPNNPEQVVVLEPNQPQFRILIVEDRLENRQLMIQLLESIGFEVQAARQGKEALWSWLNWHPHLIWMDWQMPILNGAEATAQIRKWEAERRTRETLNSAPEAKDSSPPSEHEIPPTSAFAPLDKTIIIALTASVFEDTEAEADYVGCDGFVRKPFQESELLSIMAQYLGVHYRYEGGSVPGITTIESTKVLTLSELEQQLLELPQLWLKDLLEASVTLDEAVLFECIDAIRVEHPDLAESLTQQVAKLQLDVIAHWAQNALLQSSGSANRFE